MRLLRGRRAAPPPPSLIRPRPVPGLVPAALAGDWGQQALRGTSMDPLLQQGRYVGASYRAVPWQQWTDVTVTSSLVGGRDFMGSVPSSQVDTTRWQVVNNCDCTLYVSSILHTAALILNSPDAVIGPFQSLNVTLPGPGVTMLARCFGYDFTSVRSQVSALDVRGPTAFVEVIPLGAHEDPPLPTLRSSWVRTYDKFDLTWNGNALPATFSTGTSWSSNVVELAGATSVNLQCQVTTTGALTVATQFGLQALGIASGSGNYALGTIFPTLGAGVNYLQTTVTYTANRPFVELFYTSGGNANTFTVGDLFLQAVCHA
jgi:hypothetical protein